MTTTTKGRVVYKRKKHEMTLRDPLRMLIRMSNKGEDWISAQSEFTCHAIYTVAKETYEPFWLDTLRPTLQEAVIESYWNVVEPRLRAIWQEQTANLCNWIGEEMQIPVSIREFVISHLFETIWDVIWWATDPLFRGRRQRRQYGEKK